MTGRFSPIAGATYGILKSRGAVDKLLELLGVSPDTWTLSVEDRDKTRAPEFKDLVIVGQGRPESVSHTVSLRSGRKISMGDYTPPAVTVGANVESVSFDALFAASSFIDDLDEIRTAIDSLRKPNKSLGRPPVVIWTHGSFTFRSQVIGVKTGFPHGVMVSGKHRAIHFSISLDASNLDGLDVADGAKEPETIHHILRTGETPELAAFRHLGDPNLGIKIREHNPTFLPEPTIGDSLKVLSRTHSKMRGPLTPSAAPFRTPAGRARLEALIVARMGEVGIPYEDWPEEMKT